MIWSALITLAARAGIPERLQRIAAWAAIVAAILAIVGAILLTWRLWLGGHDKAVITTENAKVEQTASTAREKSADERVVDALANQIERSDREAAIAKAEAVEAAKPPAERATLPPTTLALNCARLKRAGLTGSDAYRDRCN